jgi:hypothetical protein
VSPSSPSAVADATADQAELSPQGAGGRREPGPALDGRAAHRQPQGDPL